MMRLRLPRSARLHMCGPMRHSPLLLALLAAPAFAAAPGPKPLGVFQDWTAASYATGGQTVCYAFTRPTNSVPKLPGRGGVMLTVTERPGSRDEVVLDAGYQYPAKSEPAVQVGPQSLSFYTSGQNAFARDGHAAVMAFEAGAQAVARSPAPTSKTQVVDTFSLNGFTAAYNAVVKACPAK